jgi:hypothetical protein
MQVVRYTSKFFKHWIWHRSTEGLKSMGCSKSKTIVFSQIVGCHCNSFFFQIWGSFSARVISRTRPGCPGEILIEYPPWCQFWCIPYVVDLTTKFKYRNYSIFKKLGRTKKSYKHHPPVPISEPRKTFIKQNIVCPALKHMNITKRSLNKILSVQHSST